MFGRVIFSGKSLLQERKSPSEITLTEPGLEAFDFAKRYSFGQSVGKSCKTTLLPSYPKCFFSSIEVHVVAWLAQREDSRGEFQDGTLGGGGGGRGVLSTPTNSKHFGKYCSIIRKIANYFNASIGRVETGCHTATTAQ